MTLPIVFVTALILTRLAAAEPPPKAQTLPKTPTTARVVIMQDTNAMDTFVPNPAVVQRMVNDGLLHLTGKTNLIAAWHSLISTKDIVGLKVLSTPGPTSGTRPAVVEAVVKSLIASGLPRKNIIIWDKKINGLVRAGYADLAKQLGVRMAGAEDEGYDETTQPYDSAILGQLVYGDHDFGKKGEAVGRKSYVSKLVAKEMTRIINISPLLNHNLAGVSGNLFSVALGSVDNTMRFEGDQKRLDAAVPEIYALPVLGDRVALNIVDALLCQFEGEQTSMLHYSVALNQIRFSTDPVALDVLAIEDLKRQREIQKMPELKVSLDLYQNASLLEIGISDPKNITVDTYREK
jgi:hypothetical protein